MFAIKAVVLFGLVGIAIATDCISDMGKRCKPKSEVNSYWASKYTTGDPCFLDSNKRYCFVTDSMRHPCSCTAECGCIGAPVVPSCDNSAVPKNPDCTADKTTYCAKAMDETDDDGVTYKNTMCQYCGVNTAACNKLCSRLFTEAEKKEIVDKHNALRRTVAKGLETQGIDGPQPKAADMYELVWDEGLAASAQRWADQCPTYAVGHDKARLVVGFSYVGQNMAWSGGANSVDKGLSTMVQMWYDEVKLFSRSSINKYDFVKGTGHYTQVVWASTKKVGCGFVQYATTTGSLSKILVCNYGDGGNMIGDKMYTVGTAGSKCPNGANDGLCKQ